MRKYIFKSLLIALSLWGTAQAAISEPIKPVKNIIVMIPDGTSLATVSMARWYQRYADPEKKQLNIDPYICGTVITYSSNAPIGDSAPTTSCYMTGMPTITGFVSTYPWHDGKNNLIPVDSTRAHSPLATVLEAAKIRKGYKTGLVFTCEFPHATPADCSAHSPKRSDYATIGEQMVHQNLNVVIGGGAGLLSDAQKQLLSKRGNAVYLNDMESMRKHTQGNMWSLYAKRDMPYDFDRDTTQYPSLAEMTAKAIELLEQDSKGFFLMVEGSKVDWAAHSNDPVGMVSDFLAFDRACRVALDFAKADGNTAVIILPDHGNSGVSIGKRSYKNYDKLNKDQLFAQLARFKYTAAGLTERINETPYAELQKLMQDACGFELNADELERLNNCLDYKHSPIPAEKRSKDKSQALYSGSLETFISHLFADHTSIGFTTGGHTGEEVFLACYNPNGQPLGGAVQNTDVNHYLMRLLDADIDLRMLTDEIFVPHTQVFEGYQYQLDSDSHVLTVKSKRHTLTIAPNTNIITIDAGKKKSRQVELNSVMPFMKVNNTLYLPRSASQYLK